MGTWQWAGHSGGQCLEGRPRQFGAGYFQASELMGPLDSMQGLNLQLYNTNEIILSIH